MAIFLKQAFYITLWYNVNFRTNKNLVMQDLNYVAL